MSNLYQPYREASIEEVLKMLKKSSKNISKGVYIKAERLKPISLLKKDLHMSFEVSRSFFNGCLWLSQPVQCSNKHCNKIWNMFKVDNKGTKPNLVTSCCCHSVANVGDISLLVLVYLLFTSIKSLVNFASILKNVLKFQVIFHHLNYMFPMYILFMQKCFIYYHIPIMF